MKITLAILIAALVSGCYGGYGYNGYGYAQPYYSGGYGYNGYVRSLTTPGDTATTATATLSLTTTGGRV